ncbi:flagellar hook-basal body complex protein [Parvularcula oceani]|jgi:flagellar basal-body rod protein FlgF|uniref:flagellar hook-basal body complex protein n=1 Tax=Parvularcula oceani TaxID=1247963 RepID=UPI0004E17FDE|nr:flagellar hook-basal body complex protein [Parvularcula oceani]
MSDAITASLSRQTGLLKELSVLAGNIANAGTAGFKREASVFTEYVNADLAPGGVAMGALRGRYAVMEEGALVETGGTYDLALTGEGFFGIQRDGEVLLTRAGRFQTDMEGRLITARGDLVLDEGGGAIEIPQEAAEVVFSPDGTLSADGLAIAQIGVFDAPQASMKRVGDTLWRPEGGYAPREDAQLRQGFLEQSNVNPVAEMARLVEAQRLFEAGQNLIETEHRRMDALLRALNELR